MMAWDRLVPCLRSQIRTVARVGCISCKQLTLPGPRQQQVVKGSWSLRSCCLGVSTGVLLFKNALLGGAAKILCQWPRADCFLDIHCQNERRAQEEQRSLFLPLDAGLGMLFIFPPEVACVQLLQPCLFSPLRRLQRVLRVQLWCWLPCPC